jgi:hypothetical protein
MSGTSFTGQNMASDYDLTRKALVTLSIEKALLDMGKPIYYKVVGEIHTRYHCYLGDCYEHPEYLNAVLKHLLGKSHKTIIESITSRLQEFSRHKEIESFISHLGT